MSFQNKVVIITGASSGIGAASAVTFSKEGANVVLVARNETKLQKVFDECSGDNNLVIKADLTNENEVKNIVDETVAKYGRIDVLVNNAGAIHKCSILDGTALKAYDLVSKIHLHAVMLLTTLTAPYLIKTKGNIVNVSSIGGMTKTSFPFCMNSTVTKAGQDMFMKSAALELGNHGVRVNSVNPGPVYTDILEQSGIPGTYDDYAKLTAMNRVSQPEEIADLILFLASDKAQGINGATHAADNGMMVGAFAGKIPT